MNGQKKSMFKEKKIRKKKSPKKPCTPCEAGEGQIQCNGL